MNVVPLRRAPHTDPSPVSIWMVTATSAGVPEPLFAVRSEEEAVALVDAGHGADYREVRLLAPGAAPVQVRAWSGYLAYRTLEPRVHEELVYAWDAPGPCEDGSLPGGDGQGVYGTDEKAVRAALEAWAARVRASAYRE